MLNVVFVLCDQMLATSVTLPLELLRAAESYAQLGRSTDKTYIDRTSKAKLNIQLASVSGNSVTTHTGITLTPDSAICEIDNADIIFLPALWRNPKPILKQNDAIPPWLQSQFEKGCLIAGVGTGCCFMAEAGLLNDRPATTHWFFFDKFQQWYPQVRLKRQYFITESAGLYCTGSVNSLGDLTVFFIQRYFSQEIATHVERHFFHEIRRAYESDKLFQDTLQVHPDEDIIQAQIWLKDNLVKNIKVNELAEQFDMSERTFSRRFKNATGSTPLKYLQKLRMEMAKELIKSSNLSINEVMYRVGYQDPTHFSSLFKSHHGTTAGQYKKTVRGKLFSL